MQIPLISQMDNTFSLDQQQQLLHCSSSSTNPATSSNSDNCATSNGEQVIQARKLSLAAHVVATRHATTEVDVALRATDQLEAEQAELATKDLVQLQREAETVLSKHDVRPLVAAASIPLLLRDWSTADVCAWLAKLPCAAGVPSLPCRTLANHL